MRTSIKLNYSHPNTGSAENFINQTKERFIEENNKIKEWAQKELILKEFYFRSTESNSSVYILFFDSQTNAIVFEKANKMEKRNLLRSVLNGSAPCWSKLTNIK